jgi:hypothetical protein
MVAGRVLTGGFDATGSAWRLDARRCPQRAGAYRKAIMTWRGDRCDYLPWLEERLYPGDWAGQARLTWAVYAEGLDLSYDPERDQAAIRAHLADLEALRKAPGKPHLREGITSGRKGDSV